MTKTRAPRGVARNGENNGRKKRSAPKAKALSVTRQIIVLGMHRSGTSALTGALAAMGVYVGGEEELTPKSWENPAGFFERRDARKICDTLLQRSNADWWKVCGFHPDNVNHEAVRAQRPAIRELISQLNERGTWALKEPRLCLLLPIFQSTLSNSLAVVTIRHPVEIARSLRRRNGFPVQAGLALWEAYTVSLLREVRELDHVFVDFHELTRDPRATLASLRSELVSRGIRGLDLEAAVKSVQPSLRRERVEAETDDDLLSAAQAALWANLSGDRAWETPPQLSTAAISVLREFEADEASRQESRASIKHLMGKITALETAGGEVKAADQRRVAEAQEAGKRASQLASEVEKLKGELRARDAAVSSLNERLGSEGRRIEQLTGELSARSSDVAGLRTTLAELRRNHDEESERLEAERRATNEIRDTMSAREVEIATLQVRLSELERRYAEQQRRNEAQGREAEQLRSQLSALQSQSADREAAVAALEARCTEREQRIAADAGRTEELRREIGARDSQIGELRTEVGELRGRHLEQVERTAAELRRVDELQGQLLSRDAQIEALGTEIGKLERGYRQQSEDLDRERTLAKTLRGDLAKRDALLLERQAALDRLQQRNAENGRRLEAEALRVEALLADVSSRDSLLFELRAACGAAENDNAKLRAEQFSLSSQLSELEYRHTKQTERLDDVVQRFKADRKRRRALNAKLDRQLARAAAQQATIDSLLTEKNSLALEKQAAEGQLATLQSSRSWRLVSAVSRFRQRVSIRRPRSDEPQRQEAGPPPLIAYDRPSEAEQARAIGADAGVPVAGETAAVDVVAELPAPTVAARTQSRPGGKLPINALVITWDIGHNPLGRSYMLAEVVDRVARHTVVAGFQFARYGKTVWEPLRNSRLPVIKIPGRDFPDFIDVVDDIARVVRPDVVIACKPRLPSLQLGLKIKERCGCPLIVDIDDHELSFFKDQTPLTLEALEAEQARALRESVEPYGQTWTRLAESLLDAADARLVSNTALQERYGGHLVPHVRDEKVFDPGAVADRGAIRRRFGIPTESKVVLFFGTPRQHKGIEALADAVGRITDPNFRLVVVGRAPDRSVTAMLEQKAPGRVIQLPNQPFSAIPEVLACADVVALPQDVDHPVSLYQLPAKAIDAIGMGVPLLVSRTPPLMDLVRHGVATLIDKQDLAGELEKAIRDGMSREQSDERRARFLESYSYASAAAQMREIIKDVMRPSAKRSSGGLATRLANAERSVFGAPDRRVRDSGGGHDVVLFWKQNDTTLYGRRHDMIIKYLASRPDTRRILVFDAPISTHTLLELRDQPGDRTQHRHVYVRTEEKRLGLRDQGKIRYRVFAYQAGMYRLGSAVDDRPALSDAYMEFIRDCLRAEGIDSGQAVFWFYPKNELIPRIVETFKPLRTVVDVVDDHRAWPNVSQDEAKRLTKQYREALSVADFAFANCEPVCESMREFFPSIQLIPNGCDLDPSVTEPVDSPEFDQLQRWQGKVIGFVGNLETKIDVELLHRVAAEFSESLLVLAGSTHANPSVIELTRHANVLMPGVVPYEQVGAWVRRFDVAIIPHRKSNLTKNMNPLKLFVYAAHQIPVVSTAIPNLDERLQNLFVAQSDEDFIEKVRAILTGRSPLVGCPDYGPQNSWESRFKDAVDVILERRELRRASSAS